MHEPQADSSSREPDQRPPSSENGRLPGDPRAREFMNETVSIIVPVYNEVRTVRAVLDRLLTMNLPIAREVVVVDDGSTDGTPQVLDAAEREGLPITILPSPQNRGKGNAIRLGFEHARGTIVAIQDADLELDPQELAGLIISR